MGCCRKPDSVVLPLLTSSVLIGIVAAAGVQTDRTISRPTLLEPIAGLLSAPERPESPTATLGEPFQTGGALIHVDLSEQATKRLTDGTITVARNTLESLPTGRQEMCGVPFEIDDAVIQLTSARRERFPKAVRVPVDKKFLNFYVLHATQGGQKRIPEKTEIGKYIMHYADGETEVFPIVYGEDVRDWWNIDDSRKLRRGRVGWVGSNPGVRSFGHSLRLFVSRWTNPRPHTDVSEIEFVSNDFQSAAPFCVAMTLEELPENASRP